MRANNSFPFCYVVGEVALSLSLVREWCVDDQRRLRALGGLWLPSLPSESEEEVWCPLIQLRLRDCGLISCGVAALVL